jgi:xylulokinase
MTGAEPLVLGIDASTTACKAVLWDLTGRAVAEGRASLPMAKPRPLWHEQPAAAWWSSLVTSVRAAMDGVDAARVAALCIAPQRETFVPVDAEGEPLRPALLWMDERAHALLPEIAGDYGGERIHRETGKPLSGNLSLGKIAWLRAHEPDVFARTVRFLDVAGYLHHKLTGEYVTGWGCVDPMGLFDMRNACWDEDLLGYLGVAVAQMPQAHPPGSVIGEVTAGAAAACGLRAGTPVVAGVGDGQAGGAGVGITRPGQAYLNLGTAVVSGTYSEDYVIDRAFRTMFGAVPGTYSLETVLLGGTYTVTWFAETFAGAEDEVAPPGEVAARYDDVIAEIPPGAEGLVLVPYWNSAMNPYWDAEASGLVVGWRGVHTRAHLYRAILEGIAFEVRLHIEGVEAALAQPVRSLVAMGGGTRSRHWPRIIADVTGKPIFLAETPEAAALGAGIQAAAGVGCFAGVREAADAMTHMRDVPVEPDADGHAFYTRLYEEVYRHLFPALRPYVDRLTTLIQSSPEG